jgi:hypothetical protein
MDALARAGLGRPDAFVDMVDTEVDELVEADLDRFLSLDTFEWLSILSCFRPRSSSDFASCSSAMPFLRESSTEYSIGGHWKPTFGADLVEYRCSTLGRVSG